MSIPQMSVGELKRRLDAGDDLLVLDVREPNEFATCNINGKLIPMNTVPARLHEIERDREIVVHCRSGMRSQKVAEFLAANGYERVSNLSGGILAWADQIDPSMPKY